MNIYDVCIIGSGPAALTAAIYTSRASLSTLVLAGKKPGGQLMLTTEVENYPGFPKGIKGPELMGAMRKQAERFSAKIKDEQVRKVNFATNRSYKAYTTNTTYTSRAVIIATGADTRWLGIPGEQRLIGRGVSSCAPCDAFFFKGKKVIVVGGGDAAMEEALVLTKFASSITIVHRRDSFRASKIMADRILKHPKIKVLWNSEVTEVLGKEKVEAVKIKTTLSEKDIKKISPAAQKLPDTTKSVLKFPARAENFKKLKLPNYSNNPNSHSHPSHITHYTLPAEGVFVAIGHIPNTDIFKGKLDLDKKGFIKRFDVKDKNGLLKYRSATSIEGVFVAGDVHDYHYRQAVTAAAYGCQAALDVERWLEENKY
jgi:thioredoxin reductase (NADPH)